MNTTNDWHLRCPRCGLCRPLAETKATRLGAASIGKRILSWCSSCRWFRWAVVERMQKLESR